MKIAITDSAVAAMSCSPERAREYYWDTELRGFGVDVKPSGTKTFIVRGRIPGQRALVKRTIGIAGKPGPEGQIWNVQMARVDASLYLESLKSKKRSQTARNAPLIPRGDVVGYRLVAIHANGREIDLFAGRAHQGVCSGVTSDRRLAVWIEVQPRADVCDDAAASSDWAFNPETDIPSEEGPF